MGCLEVNDAQQCSELYRHPGRGALHLMPFLGRVAAIRENFLEEGVT